LICFKASRKTENLGCLSDYLLLKLAKRFKQMSDTLWLVVEIINTQRGGQRSTNKKGLWLVGLSKSALRGVEHPSQSNDKPKHIA
jgi:hypothetical protein